MLRRTLLPLLLVVALAGARGALDLTPTPHETTCEGFTFKELLFKDGKRQVLYQLPNKWTYRAGGDGVHLIPPQTAFAEALIQGVLLATPKPFDEKAIEGAKQQFLSTLPLGSHLTGPVTEAQNPVPLNGNPTYEFIATYQLMGETFLRSTLFTNQADTQLTFRLTARKNEFESLHRLFRASMLTWQWTEQSPVATKHEPTMASAPAAQVPSAAN
jgi:hypothetical protein